MNETNSNFDETFGVNNNTLDQLDVSDIIQNGNSNSGIGDDEQSLEPLNAVNDQNHQFPVNTTVESTDDTPNNNTIGIGMIIKVKQQVEAKIIEVLELRAKVEESHTADKQEEEMQLQGAEGQLYSLYELKCKLFSSLQSQGRYAEARLLIWQELHGLDNNSIRRIKNELVHAAANGGAGSGDSSVGSSSNSGSDEDDISIRDTSTNDELNHQSSDNTVEEEVAAAESPVKEVAVTPPSSTNQDVPDSTASQQHDDYIPTALKSQISNQEDELTNLLSSIDQLKSTPGRIALMLHNDEDTDEGLVGIVDMSNVSSGDGRGGVMRSGGLSPVKKRLIMDNGDTPTEESLIEEEVKEEVESLLVMEEEFKYKSPPEVKVPATPASLPQSPTTDNTLSPPTGVNVSLLNSAKSTSKEMSQDKALHDSKRMTKQQQVNASPIEVVTGEVDSMTSMYQSSYNTPTLLIPTLSTNGEEQRGTDNQEVTSATAIIEKKNDTSMADEHVDSSEEKKLALKEKVLMPASSDSFDTGSSDDNLSSLEAHHKKKSTQHEQANGNAANVQASKRNMEEDEHSVDESRACNDPVQTLREDLMKLGGDAVSEFKQDFYLYIEQVGEINDKWNKNPPEKSPEEDTTSVVASPPNNEDLIHVDENTTDTDWSSPLKLVGEVDSPTQEVTNPLDVCQEGGGSNSSDSILGSNSKETEHYITGASFLSTATQSAKSRIQSELVEDLEQQLQEKEEKEQRKSGTTLLPESTATLETEEALSNEAYDVLVHQNNQQICAIILKMNGLVVKMEESFAEGNDEMRLKCQLELQAAEKQLTSLFESRVDWFCNLFPDDASNECVNGTDLLDNNRRYIELVWIKRVVCDPWNTSISSLEGLVIEFDGEESCAISSLSSTTPLEDLPDTATHVDKAVTTIGSNSDSEVVHSTVEASFSSTTTQSATAAKSSEAQLEIDKEREQQLQQKEKEKEQLESGTTLLLENDQSTTTLETEAGKDQVIASNTKTTPSTDEMPQDTTVQAELQEATRFTEQAEAETEREKTAADQAERDKAEFEAELTRVRVELQDAVRAAKQEAKESVDKSERTANRAKAAAASTVIRCRRTIKFHAKRHAKKRQDELDAQKKDFAQARDFFRTHYNRECKEHDKKIAQFEDERKQFEKKREQFEKESACARKDEEESEAFALALFVIAIAIALVVVFLPNILGIKGSLWLSYMGVFILGIECSLFFGSVTRGGYSI